MKNKSNSVAGRSSNTSSAPQGSIMWKIMWWHIRKNNLDNHLRVEVRLMTFLWSLLLDDGTHISSMVSTAEWHREGDIFQFHSCSMISWYFRILYSLAVSLLHTLMLSCCHNWYCYCYHPTGAHNTTAVCYNIFGTCSQIGWFVLDSCNREMCLCHKLNFKVVSLR